MAKNLTDISIRNLKPGAARREIPDGNGLYVVLQATGARSFALRYRRNGRPIKFTLGTWWAGDPKEAPEPKIGGVLTLAGARKLAAEAMLQIGRGADPVESKRWGKQQQRQAKANTFRAVADDFFRREAGMKIDRDGKVTFGTKMRSASDRYAALKRLAFPVIGDKPISEIRRSDIVGLLDDVEDEAGPVMADRTLAYVRRVFSWLAARSDDFNSPIVRGMARTKPKDRERSRVLTDDELRAVWKVAGEDGGTFASLVRFLLLTAARRNEASEMTWAEIKDSDWTLPASRNKAKINLTRPLSKAARAVLEARPQIEGNPHVFTSGRGSFSGFSKSKRVFDEAVFKKLRGENAEAKAVPNWTLHDLRRTARSLMSRAGVNSDHAERCLGHVIGGVAGIYDQHKYHAEMQKAYDALAALIATIVDPPEGNVVPFAGRREHAEA